MFPVKRACQIREIATALLCVALLGCGYRPAYGGAAPEQRLSVTAAPAGMSRPEALQGALAGVREELSSAGALRPGSAYPRVVVQVLRVDESSSGIAALGDQPLARGSSVGVLGRAWVEERAGARPAADTGNVRRVVRYASSTDPQVEERRQSDALRAASRELGRALGRRLLGEPVPANEAL